MKSSKKNTVVISAVNFVEAGPLSIFKDAVNAFVDHYIAEYDLVLFVHDKKLFERFSGNTSIQICEYAYPKRSWLLRVWFEYVHCYFITKKIKPYFFFALHDMTPNVYCNKKAVYCHNPAPFYKFSLKELMMEKSLIFFRYFYSFFYRINIRSNNFVIVQQDRLRRIFMERYKVKNVIVAYPNISINTTNISKLYNDDVVRFFYPAYPRSFKNFEVLLQAAEELKNENLSFEILVTLSGSENKYAGYLKEKYGHISQIKFIGLQPREKVFELYNSCDCLVFPSKLETWGLPITEMKFFEKPIFAADLDYARETTGNYNKAIFFEATDAKQLAAKMKTFIEKKIVFEDVVKPLPAKPFTQNWYDLFALLLA